MGSSTILSRDANQTIQKKFIGKEAVREAASKQAASSQQSVDRSLISDATV